MLKPSGSTAETAPVEKPKKPRKGKAGSGSASKGTPAKKAESTPTSSTTPRTTGATVLKALAKAKKDNPQVFEAPAADETFETGFISLQPVMGGGPRRGRVVEIFGNEGTGKTTLTVQCAGYDLNQPGDVALFKDYEHTFSPKWVAAYTGRTVVHLSNSEAWFKEHGDNHPPCFLWTQPSNLESGTQLADDLLRAFGPRLKHVICDSVAQMTPKAQVARLEDATEDTNLPAIRARVLGWWLENAVDMYHRNGTCIWLVNQVREKIGAMGFSELAKLQTPGGRAPKFAATHRLFLKPAEDRRWQSILGKDRGAVLVTCVKNKVNPTKTGRCKLILVPGLGFSREIELLDICEERKVLKPGGPAGSFIFDGRGPFTRKALLQALWDKDRGPRFRYMLENALRTAVFSHLVDDGELMPQELPMVDLHVWQKEFEPVPGSMEGDVDAVREAILSGMDAVNTAPQLPPADGFPAL